jgi:flagellar M-ring protein FliF
VWQPRSADELRNLTALAQAAVGFDASRGDVLTVQDIGFDGNRAATPAPFLEQMTAMAAGSPQLIKYGALLVGLIVVLAFGVRPALKGASPPKAKDAGKDGAKVLTDGAAMPASMPLPSAEPVETDPERLRNMEIFEQVTSHLKREPTQSSRLLQACRVCARPPYCWWPWASPWPRRFCALCRKRMCSG